MEFVIIGTDFGWWGEEKCSEMEENQYLFFLVDFGFKDGIKIDWMRN